MLSSYLAVGLGAALAQGLAVRGGCDLSFTVSGSKSDDVGQISSGQVRFGGNLGSATFVLQGDELFDSQGRGCFFTPPTKTFQCDASQNPANGFKIACDGSVSFQGQTTFYECDAGNGEYNIYLAPNGVNCGKITLHSSDCHASCPPPGCPADLSGTYEFPHLIIPVDSSSPNTAAGTSFNGVVSSTVSSLFNFDIPSSDSGKTCSLVFLFPNQADLVTSSYTFSGNGGLDFARLDNTASSDTTFNNMPGVATDYGTTTVAPGNSYSIATFDCPAGQAIGFEVSAVGNTMLTYFQDYNPSPIGLYITVC